MWKKVVAKPNRKKEELDELFRTRPLFGKKQGIGLDRKLNVNKSIEKVNIRTNTRLVST